MKGKDAGDGGNRDQSHKGNRFSCVSAVSLVRSVATFHCTAQKAPLLSNPHLNILSNRPE